MFKATMFLLLGSLSLAASAEGAGKPGEKVGDETRAWTQLQAGGSAASTVERPMSGDVAERVYDRYANSFNHPIPDQFKRDSFVEQGSGK